MEAFDFRTARGETGPVARSAAATMAAAVPRSALVLAAMLRRSVEADSEGPHSLRPGELEEMEPVWFALGRLGLAAVPGAAVVALADALMGGPGLAEDREATALEINLVATRLTMTLAPVANALEGYGLPDLVLEPVAEAPTIGGALTGFGLNFAIAPPAWSIEAPTEVPVTIAFPAALFSHHDRSHAAMPAALPEIEAALRSVPLEVDVRFHPLSLAAGELDELSVGDVIRLDHPVDDPLTGVVDGRPLFLARLARAGRNVAVEIVDVTEECRP